MIDGQERFEGANGDVSAHSFIGIACGCPSIYALLAADAPLSFNLLEARDTEVPDLPSELGREREQTGNLGRLRRKHHRSHGFPVRDEERREGEDQRKLLEVGKIPQSLVRLDPEEVWFCPITTLEAP